MREKKRRGLVSAVGNKIVEIVIRQYIIQELFSWRHFVQLSKVLAFRYFGHFIVYYSEAWAEQSGKYWNAFTLEEEEKEDL